MDLLKAETDYQDLHRTYQTEISFRGLREFGKLAKPLKDKLLGLALN